jgi:hypothetical protein
MTARPLLRPLLRDVRQRGRWSPTSLFAAGEQGVWYDPSDLSSMFQDSAGTTPVTAAGQPVGKINDKSGRGNHATQATAASRPTLQQDASGFYYLACDGVDDGIVSSAINFTGTSKITVVAGAMKTNVAPAAFEALVDLSADPNANPNTFALGASTTSGDASRRTYGAFITGPGPTVGGLGAGVYAAPDSAVLTAAFDLTIANGGAGNTTLRRNGVAVTPSYAPDITPGVAFANAALYIARRGGASAPFTGRIYGLIVRGAVLDAAQRSAGERYIAGKMGIAL